MKTPVTLAILALACALTPPALHAQEEAPSASPKVVGILFYADTCGSCKVLDPKIEAVKKEFAEEAVLFTRVDLSNDFTKHQSKLHCSLMGLNEIYAEHSAKTGFMLLVDAKEKKVLGKLVKTQTEDEIKAAIKTALAAR